jgi:hypothetical protein
MKFQRIKKALCLIIVIAVATSGVGLNMSAYASKMAFSDVKEKDWFFPYIDMLTSKNMVKGNDDGTYAPDRTLNADEFLAFALRTMGQDQPNADGYWARNYIDKALELGLISPREYLRYDEPISREKIAKIIVRAVDYEYKDYEKYSDMFSDFKQAGEKEYILKAIELGVLAGYDDGTFRPRNTATRAEAAAMVVRMVDSEYRLQIFGKVFLNPKLDINENGNVKPEKVYDFTMMFVEDFKLEKTSDGKVTFKGDIPEVPEGQMFFLRIMCFNSSGKILDGTYMPTTITEKNKIPTAGELDIKTSIEADKVYAIRISIAVCNADNNNYAACYVIYKEYDEPYDKFFTAKIHDVGIFDLDPSLVEGIWGW